LEKRLLHVFRAYFDKFTVSNLLRLVHNIQIALYFVFLSHYTNWLGWLAGGGLVTGLSILIVTGVKGNFQEALNSNPAVPFFCIYVSAWSQLMIEYWKRKEVTKAVG
jgi:hypothetical protein